MLLKIIICPHLILDDGKWVPGFCYMLDLRIVLIFK